MFVMAWPIHSSTHPQVANKCCMELRCSGGQTGLMLEALGLNASVAARGIDATMRARVVDRARSIDIPWGTLERTALFSKTGFQRLPCRLDFLMFRRGNDEFFSLKSHAAHDGAHNGVDADD
jgi:hypothetical protein